jgi:hypothetical protein
MICFVSGHDFSRAENRCKHVGFSRCRPHAAAEALHLSLSLRHG